MLGKLLKKLIKKSGSLVFELGMEELIKKSGSLVFELGMEERGAHTFRANTHM